MKTKVCKLEEMVKEGVEDLDSVQNALKAKEAEVTKLESSVGELKVNLAAATQSTSEEKSSAADALSKLEKQKKAADLEVKKLSTEAAKLKQAAAKQDNDIQELKAAAATFDEEMTRQKDEVAELKAKLESAAEESVTNLQNHMDKVKKSNNKILEDEKKDKAKIQQELEAANTTKEELDKALLAATASADAVRLELDASKLATERSSREAEERFSAEIERLREDNESLQSKLQLMESAKHLAVHPTTNPSLKPGGNDSAMMPPPEQRHLSGSFSDQGTDSSASCQLLLPSVVAPSQLEKKPLQPTNARKFGKKSKLPDNHSPAPSHSVARPVPKDMTPKSSIVPSSSASLNASRDDASDGEVMPSPAKSGGSKRKHSSELGGAKPKKQSAKKAAAAAIGTLMSQQKPQYDFGSKNSGKTASNGSSQASSDCASEMDIFNAD